MKKLEVDLIKKENLDTIRNGILAKYLNACEEISFKAKVKPLGSEITLTQYERPDILFKVILRVIRKTYLEEFIKNTNYHKIQRYRHTTFLLVTLEKYIN